MNTWKVTEAAGAADDEDASSGFDADRGASYDWDDPDWDHHFGMEHPTAGDPYNNRGRSDGVWNILTAYGFQRAAADTPAGKKNKENKHLI